MEKPLAVAAPSALERAELADLAYQASLLVRELERRHTEDKLKYYKPHPKQVEFHKCEKRNRWVFGGNRTGKTEVGAVEAVYYARGRHPFKIVTRATDGWVVSLTNEVQRDVAQRKVLSYINPSWIKGVKMREGKADDPDNGVIDYLLIESVHGGLSKIGFKSCDQGRARFQGTSKDWIWFDEEPPEEIYMECLMRTLDCRGQIWGTMTPLMGLTWVHDTIWLNERKNPEVWTILMSWQDNPYLSKDEIALMEAQMSEEELESRREGNFVAMTGLVYREFRESIHVIEPFPVPREWMDLIAIDPGIDKPLSAHWYAVDHNGNVYVVGEWYKAGWMVSAHMREIERISNELGWPRDSRGWLSCIMDAAADQKSLINEKTVAQVFRDNRMNVNTKVNKSKFAGIQQVKSYLALRKYPEYADVDPVAWPKGKPKLFIFNTCEKLIWELKKYRWKQGTDEPEKVDDHALDELRYYIMTKPAAFKSRATEELTLIQKDKKRRAALAARNKGVRHRY